MTMIARVDGREVERSQALDALGDQTYDLRWAKDSAIGWGTGYFMLLLYPSFLLMMMPSSWKGVAPLICFGVAALAGCLIGCWIHHRGKRLSIRFNRDGFSFRKDDDPYFQLRWIDIASVSEKRNCLIIVRTDGRVEKQGIPTVNRTRESELLRRVVQAYGLPNKPLINAKRLSLVGAIMMAIGGVLMLIFGRPAVLNKDFEGTFGPHEMLGVSVWGVAAVLITLGLIFAVSPIVVWLEELLSGIGQKRQSEFGPNLEDFYKECNRWPKPVEMVVGKKYRYLDPCAIRSVMMQPVRLFGFLWLVALIMVPVSMTLKPKQGEEFSRWFILFVSIIGVVVFFSMARLFAKRLQNIGDVISITEDHLIVHREGREIIFPKSPNHPIRDDYPSKDARKPFGRSESYGKKPSMYVMDRRFLIEIVSDVEQNVDLHAPKG